MWTTFFHSGLSMNYHELIVNICFWLLLGTGKLGRPNRSKSLDRGAIRCLTHTLNGRVDFMRDE